MEIEILDAWRIRFIHWLQEHWVHGDGAHDIHHLHRVWRNCQQINAGEAAKADLLILLAASCFHDLVTLPKDHPERNRASLLSAERTVEIFDTFFDDFPKEKIDSVKHAIHAHSFSANVNTNTIEAKILQDADRLDALGATGIARLFYTAAKMNAALNHPDDPLGINRKLDDKKYALDHIEVKLLKLPATMKTLTGKAMAQKEAAFIIAFRDKFIGEISFE